MKNNVTLNEKAICDKYQNGRSGIEAIALKYHVGKKKIKEILAKYGIEHKKKGKQPLKGEFVVSDWRVEKYPTVEGYHYIAKDIKSDFTTNDYMNYGGVMTTHIKKVYGVETPTLYDRRMYYMRTGNYWWEQWFNIVLEENPKTKKCPYCDWETVDLDNKCGMFETHLLKVHKISKDVYLREHPEERDYFKLANKCLDRQMEVDENEFVTCAVCGKKLARIDMHHLKSHGITKEEYIMTYGDKGMSSKNYHEKQSKVSKINNMNSTFTKNSKSELEIVNFIKDRGLYCHTDRKILEGREIDIFIPTMNVGIEYNGNKWHTEWFGGKDRNYHYLKMKGCNEKGVKLLTIFEDEYELHKEIVLKKIAHILHLENGLEKIYGRKCHIRRCHKYEVEEFLNNNHVQGFVVSSLYLGAYYDDRLVAVMTFKHMDNDNWELTRFASDIHTICCGVGGKLFAYFIRNYNYNTIKTFADRRWTIDVQDNVYVKLGFEFDGYTPPNYTYYLPSVDRFKRFYKSMMRKGKIMKHHPELNPNMTETEMAKSLGYDRIWDCGLIRYIYRNPKYEQQYNAVRGQKAVIH